MLCVSQVCLVSMTAIINVVCISSVLVGVIVIIYVVCISGYRVGVHVTVIKYVATGISCVM